MIGFNVAQMLKAPAGTVRWVEIEELDDELVADLHIVSPTTGSLRLMRTSDGILVTGTISQRVEAVCSRCLEAFARTQAIELNDEFVPIVDVSSGLALPEPFDSEAFRLTPEHLLDLDEAIRQYAILESPLRPLCDDDCKGLCVDCGANLNLGPCGCESASGVASSGAFGTLLAERMRQAGLNPEGVD